MGKLEAFPSRAREAYLRMVDEVYALASSEDVEDIALAKIDTLVGQFIGTDLEKLKQELLTIYKEGRQASLLKKESRREN